jgi:hypothetical protein
MKPRHVMREKFYNEYNQNNRSFRPPQTIETSALLTICPHRPKRTMKMDCQQFYTKFIRLVITFMVGVSLVYGSSGSSTAIHQKHLKAHALLATADIAPSPIPQASTTPTFIPPKQTSIHTPTMQSIHPQPANRCGYDLKVEAFLDNLDQVRWVNWIRALSGERPVITGTGSGRILTRSSFVMFEPDHIPSAFQYLQDELEEMGFIPGEDFVIHTYNFPFENRHSERNWKNLILSFPGIDSDLAKERVLLVAHLDSTSGQELTLAPGADDNASGAAGLLEAAVVLRHHQHKRTINLIWFSGEEQSRIGSEYFVSDYQDWLPEIVGVINLDMFAFDWDNDRCFEIHAGTLPGSHRIGHCFLEAIKAYDLDLSFDFIDDDTAYALSDHSPFWLADVPAVMVFENAYYQEGETCGVADRNYAYHTTADTLVYINKETGFSILQAALAAGMHMAEPLGPCFSGLLKINCRNNGRNHLLSWEAMPKAGKYQIWQLTGARWRLAGETIAPRWQLTPGELDMPHKVIAVTEEGCQSLPEFYPHR